MNDERYAEQHSAPYSDNWLKKLSQKGHEMADARFQQDNGGVYFGGGSSISDWSVGEGEIGVFHLPTSWSTVRLGGIGMVAGGKPMAGADVGVRLHTPTRLAPYVGLSGVVEFGGFTSHLYTSRYRSSRQAKRYYSPTGMLAIVPEVGVSYWLSSSTRLNLGASYYVTDNRKPDFVLVSLSLDVALRDPTYPHANFPPPPRNEDFESDPYFISDDVVQPETWRGNNRPAPRSLKLSPDQIESIIETPGPLFPVPEKFIPNPPADDELPAPLQGFDTNSSGAAEPQP